MKEDNGEVGKEMERNRVTAFEFWRIEAIGYCLGTEITPPTQSTTNNKKRGRDTPDEEDELPEQVEVVLLDGTVVWN